MNGKGITLLFFIVVLSCTLGLSQDKTKDKNLIGTYNAWLKTIQLDKLLQASEIERDSSGKTVLILTPAPDIKDLQDLATNWKYVKSGLHGRGIDIYDLLWFKWVTYAELPSEGALIRVQTKDPDVFSLQLSFEQDLKAVEKNSEVRGGEISVQYNFEEAAAVLLRNIYKLKQPLQDLNVYFGQIETILKRSKHLAKTQVMVNKRSNSKEILQLEVSGMYGEATRKNYHEKIALTIVLNSSAKPQTLEYWGTVWCAGGLLNPSEFVDASNEQELRENLRLYNQRLDHLFKSLFHEKI